MVSRMMMVGNYNYILVVCSLLVAILASYTALGMVERMHVAKHARWWHLCGATAMGVGIWSMHFIGMLAFSLPAVALGYDIGLTLASLFVAIAIAYFALRQVSMSKITSKHIVLSAVLMGLGIATMHYVGMEAMLMVPAIQYHTGLFILSIVIAIAASYAALRIFLWMRTRKQHSYPTQVLAATVMGMAVVGMHYTGMMAAQFPAGSVCRAASMGFDTDTLAIIIGMGSFVLFLVANFASIFNRRTSYLIASLEQANQQLKTQSLYDYLTKLPNRVLLEERVKQALEQANHHKYFVTLMAINLDGFKTINDSIGAKAGDGFLVEIANRIRAVVDNQYTVARIAGDDFVVVLERVAPEDAAIYAEKIMHAVKQPLMAGNHELVVTASIGIAVSFISGNSYQELALNAEAALQYTKRSGKSGYHYYEEKMDVDATRQLALTSHLRHAIERGELSLHYQPKVDVATGHVYSAEALLRWNDAEYGSISPAQFIPLAEESGMIVDIGDWVLEEVCQQLNKWNVLGYDEINVALNLSSIQFLQDNLYHKIMSALEYWAISPERITLEITESTAMQDVDYSSKVLKKLADSGIRISIDDFGTGYSSLLYLQRLPADELKIDRGFIKKMHLNEHDSSLVAAIVSLAKQFGLKVVAEGVETQGQQDRLIALQCDTLQGFFLGKPRPAVAFLDENRAHMPRHFSEKVDETTRAALAIEQGGV